jgi:glycerol kinase
MEEFAAAWAVDRQFSPGMEAAVRDRRYARWRRAVEAVLAV